MKQHHFQNIRVIVTHTHFDHCGGIQFFHPKQLLLTSQMIQNIQNKNLLGLHYLHTKDFDIQQLQRSTSKTPIELCDQYSISIPKTLLTMNHPTIHIGNFHLQILPLPGHTNDSIALYEPHHQLLFSGDTLYDGNIFIHFPNSNATQLIQSLSVLLSMPIHYTFTGHNEFLNANQSTHIIQKWIQQLENKILAK